MATAFAFRAHLRELHLEFFLQVTPEQHKGWIQEVPTTLKGKYREGRSWRGFHHHLVMSAIAYLLILTTYLAAKKDFWSDVGEDPGSDPAVATEIDRTLRLLPIDISGEDR